MAKRSVDIIVSAKDQASRQLAGIGRNVDTFGKKLGNLKRLAIGAFGGVAITRGIMDTVEAFGIQEQAERKLADALANLGTVSGRANEEMRAFAASIQRQTTIGDEAVLQMMALGASLGKLSGGALRDATRAAIGLSRALGTDTTAAMRLIARAAIGDTSQLARYGIKLSELMSPQEKFNELLRIGASNFNLARGEAQTMTGQIQQMKNSWGDAKEKAGEFFLNVFEGWKKIRNATNVVIFGGEDERITRQKQTLRDLRESFDDTFKRLAESRKASIKEMSASEQLAMLKKELALAEQLRSDALRITMERGKGGTRLQGMAYQAKEQIRKEIGMIEPRARAEAEAKLEAEKRKKTVEASRGLWLEVQKMRIEATKEGLDKELALLRAKQQAEWVAAKKQGMDLKLLREKHVLEAKAAIRKFDDEAAEEAKAAAEKAAAEAQKTVDAKERAAGVLASRAGVGAVEGRFLTRAPGQDAAMRTEQHTRQLVQIARNQERLAGEMVEKLSGSQMVQLIAAGVQNG